MNRREFALGMLGAAATTGARAQSSSGRLTRIIVPYAAGNSMDAVARIMAPQLTDYLGETVIVENKPGALGLIGTADALKSAPDGKTIASLSHATLSVNAALVKPLPFDPAAGLAPIARTFTLSSVLVVRADYPARTMKEFLERAKATPAGLNAGYGSSVSQLNIAKLCALGGITTANISYKGVNLAVTDVIGGHLDFTFADLALAMPLITTGKLRALGLVSRHRWPKLDAVPPIGDTLPGFDGAGWHGYAAPAGTPRATIEKLFHAIEKIVTKPENQARWEAMYYQPSLLGPDQFAEFIRTDIDMWTRDARAAGL